ncbi:MAG TPA: DNA polymerase IV [Terriglobia bacterium]|nr:DNA polymerase IV [Terriglobia bacterium]
MRTPVILHVDMDAFFVSVERLYDPSLHGQPVIVGGRPNQRGVVAAASYEARRYGVHSAMPLTTAYRLCPQAVFLPLHRDRYVNASREIEAIFQRFSPQVEMVSVDEAYLNLTGTGQLLGDPLAAAHQLHQAVAEQTKLPCSIGISSSRLISKIASDQAKPNGILYVRPGGETAFLGPLPVGKIPGVGKKTEQRLRALGVVQIRDLLRAGRQALGKQLGSHGEALFEIAAGIRPADAEPVWGGEEAAKSLSHEETFAEDVQDARQLDRTLAELAQRVAGRLRQHGLFARTVTLKLRYANFQTLTRARTLPEATQLDGVLLQTARALLREHWDTRRKIRLLGLQASGLAEAAGQGNLLTAAADRKWSRALAAADSLRDRYGFRSVQLGATLGRARRSDRSTASIPPGRLRPSQ